LTSGRHARIPKVLAERFARSPSPMRAFFIPPAAM
jgi:hypothetical protein